MKNKELIKGVSYSFIGKYLNYFTTILMSIILTRILSPKDFGIVAVITVFLTFFNNLSDIGLSAAIIQKEKIDKKFLSTVFYFTVGLGIIVGVLFFLFSKYGISKYYGNKIYINLGLIMAFNLLVISVSTVPKGILNREKKFKELAIISFISNFISGVIAIYLAKEGYSYYSIVYQTLIMNCISLILSYICSKVKIRLEFDFKEIASIFSYSAYLFIFNFINYFARNLDNILIGKHFGVIELGYYDRAYKLMLYPLTGFTFAITSVLHPIFARYQNDKEKIYRNYIKIIKNLSLLGIFITIFSYFYSKNIIEILYGKNWLGVIPIFKFLSLSIFIQMVLSTTGSIFLSLGRSDKMFQSGLFYSGGLIIAILLGIKSGQIINVAKYLNIAFIFGFIAIYIFLLKLFNKRFIEFLIELKNTLYLGIILLFINIILIRINILDISIIDFFLKIFINGLILLIFLYKINFLRREENE